MSVNKLLESAEVHLEVATQCKNLRLRRWEYSRVSIFHLFMALKLSLIYMAEACTGTSQVNTPLPELAEMVEFGEKETRELIVRIEKWDVSVFEDFDVSTLDLVLYEKAFEICARALELGRQFSVISTDPLVRED